MTPSVSIGFVSIALQPWTLWAAASGAAAPTARGIASMTSWGGALGAPSPPPPAPPGFSFFSSSGLKDAVSYWKADEAGATDAYGAISTWDVSRVQDMAELFSNDRIGETEQNPDVSNWDVSEVTTMRCAGSRPEGASLCLCNC